MTKQNKQSMEERIRDMLEANFGDNYIYSPSLEKTINFMTRKILEFFTSQISQAQKELLERVEREIKDWRRVASSKETPKLEGEEFENGWRLGINRVCNSIEKIL